ASTNVAFTAGITSSDSSWSGSTLIFPKIIFNTGGGYNPTTGMFTGPVDGHYVFFVSVQSHDTKEIRVDIVWNGESQDYYETGVNLVVLRLNQGDKVWVKRSQGTGYYSSSVPVITTFSGFLL
ncbi:collagen alpha-2(VIII) chain-like, partial [Saccostrea cucullata]|uniref:collagen alpha-2(VIII) chain-like n=1 Tax=Saccostrea cuccullata TaxID=36930 RepID=UPI002ED06E45